MARVRVARQLSSAARGYVLLRYSYVPDMLERRQPHRAAHLEHWKRDIDSGALRLAGAYGPVDGALFVFRGKTRAYVEERARTDPYCLAELVPSTSTVDWTVVVGADLGTP
ncbi:hypothetical protein KFE25_005136 [Diacronema lutheri]|uniref:YCII-related domain-containing protein n=1 Tax=Diacronema lutheri TaxID=2081491 RepID=A0A8J6C2B1_DIALT|nr:hypothetical protein KFE25_005136 [Diacronema lutheri]